VTQVKNRVEILVKGFIQKWP